MSIMDMSNQMENQVGACPYPYLKYFSGSDSNFFLHPSEQK
jgi:hypothetical protein